MCLLDPLEGPQGPYSFKKDSSHLLMLELERRGYSLFYAAPSSFIVQKNQFFIKASPVSVLEKAPYFIFNDVQVLPLHHFQLILVRKDPPVDEAYLTMTHILSFVSKKIPVINDPQTLRDWNEKLMIFNFPQWIPKTSVTAHETEMDRFMEECGGMAVIKSLQGFAGKRVVRLSREKKDGDTHIKDLTKDGTVPIMIQEYLPSVSQGEKRIFMLGGRPLGALLKIPLKGNWLTNPDQGAHLAPTKLTRREKELCSHLGRFLRQQKIFFAGVDVIDEKLTEINITSPGLICEWNEVDHEHHEVEMINLLEKKFLKK